MFKKGKFGVVSNVVTKGQVWVVIGVIRNSKIRVAIKGG